MACVNSRKRIVHQTYQVVAKVTQSYTKKPSKYLQYIELHNSVTKSTKSTFLIEKKPKVVFGNKYMGVDFVDFVTRQATLYPV